MSYKIIASSCTGCSLCEFECPNAAISMKGDTFVINPKKCTECEGHSDHSPAATRSARFPEPASRLDTLAVRLAKYPAPASGVAPPFALLLSGERHSPNGAIEGIAI